MLQNKAHPSNFRPNRYLQTRGTFEKNVKPKKKKENFRSSSRAPNRSISWDNRSMHFSKTDYFASSSSNRSITICGKCPPIDQFVFAMHSYRSKSSRKSLVIPAKFRQSLPKHPSTYNTWKHRLKIPNSLENYWKLWYIKWSYGCWW